MRRVGKYPLWIGTARDARDIRGVLDAGIEAMVDLAMEEPPAQPTRELAYLRFPLVDGDGNPPWLLSAAVQAVGQLFRQGVPTLAACGMGMSRSPAVVAAAVAAVEGRAPEEVLEQIRAGGPADVQPAFWETVRRFGLPGGAANAPPRGEHRGRS